jgi:SNF2 family DNA or RNA helicase
VKLPSRTQPKEAQAPKKYTKGKDTARIITATRPSSWMDKWDAGEVELLETAKLKHLTVQMMAWINEAPLEKIIVFTQFRQFAVIVGRLLEKRNIGFLYYMVNC